MTDDRYETARVAGKMVVFIGWLAFAGGIADDTRQTAEATRLMLAHIDDALSFAKWLAKPAIEARRAQN